MHSSHSCPPSSCSHCLPEDGRGDCRSLQSDVLRQTLAIMSASLFSSGSAADRMPDSPRAYSRRLQVVSMAPYYCSSFSNTDINHHQAKTPTTLSIENQNQALSSTKNRTAITVHFIGVRPLIEFLTGKLPEQRQCLEQTSVRISTAMVAARVGTRLQARRHERTTTQPATEQ